VERNKRKDLNGMKTRIFFIVFGACFCLFSSGTVYALESKTSSKTKRPSLKPREIKSDTNYDGKIDRTEVYDAEGNVQSVEVDTNADGKVDEWLEFKDGVRTQGKRDMDGDGDADVFLEYNEAGELTQLKSDTSGDGEIDEWVFYENGEPKSAEKDTNGDGKADTWIEY
jgi:antitoxin component YwqK of YwqJK toxin-antitoxin module